MSEKKKKRSKGRPGKLKRKRAPSAKRSRKTGVDWEPLKESRYKGDQGEDSEKMTVEDRKAAQLAKWKKELGLEEEE